MTPTARQELRRYCQDAARARMAREPWSFADRADAVVAILCTAGLVFLAGYSTAQHQHEARAKSCAASLPDGRRLLAYHLGMDGPEKCTYEAGKTPAKWRQM